VPLPLASKPLAGPSKSIPLMARMTVRAACVRLTIWKLDVFEEVQPARERDLRGTNNAHAVDRLIGN
jgi:hypothetical protein